MLTTDLSLRFDPAYEKISRRFLKNPDQFADAFARAWFKLTHRDMGPIARYLGPLVPKETLIWQDPIPKVNHKLVGDKEIAALKAKIVKSGLSIPGAGLDRVGLGLDVPRLRQARRRERRAHAARAAEGLGGQPAGAARKGAEEARSHPGGLQQEGEGRQESVARGPHRAGRRRGGREGREERRREAQAAFKPGRMDASQDQTDVESFAPLEPLADGFRNYVSRQKKQFMKPEEALVDRAQLLRLTAPEMTVLVGGLRVLGANAGGSKHGVFTKRVGTLSNDWFVNLLDMDTKWQPAGENGVRRSRSQDECASGGPARAST